MLGLTRVLKRYLIGCDPSTDFLYICLPRLVLCLALDATRVAHVQGFIGSWAGVAGKMGNHGA